PAFDLQHSPRDLHPSTAYLQTSLPSPEHLGWLDDPSSSGFQSLWGDEAWQDSKSSSGDEAQHQREVD
ncbi:MAG: hypothetical protein WB755_29195, partial [Terriglobales bacterium]